MPENKQRNPFEDHIESESFDLSGLENMPAPSEVDGKISQFLDGLPQPLNYELYDNALDDQQKHICAHLVMELVGRMRAQYGEDLAEMTDEQLVYVLNLPVMVGMLAEQELHAAPRQLPAVTPVMTMSEHPLSSSEQWDNTSKAQWGDAMVNVAMLTRNAFEGVRARIRAVSQFLRDYFRR